MPQGQQQPGGEDQHPERQREQRPGRQERNAPRRRRDPAIITTVFTALTCLVLVWAAYNRFEVPPAQLAWMLLFCLAGVFFTATLAVIFTFIRFGLRALTLTLRGFRLGILRPLLRYLQARRLRAEAAARASGTRSSGVGPSGAQSSGAHSSGAERSSAQSSGTRSSGAGLSGAHPTGSPPAESRPPEPPD